MTQLVGYVLHRFPMHTDTFIRREIATLRELGTRVEVISVWKPAGNQVSPELMREWEQGTHYLLPGRPLHIMLVLLSLIIRRPGAFLGLTVKAFRTRKPGLKGALLQAVYVIEALLAADISLKRGYTHLHNHIGDQSGTVAMLASHYTGINFSITYHGWPVFFDAYNSRIKEKVLAASFTRSISQFCRSQLLMFSGRTSIENFEIVHCGLKLGSYVYREPRRDVRSLFCAARLSPEKGMWCLVEALRTLVDKGHDIRLRLGGDGPSRVELEEQCKLLGLDERVSFLGYLDEAQVISELQNCDMFVLPSFVEGVPVSAMEAMAVGVPVVATNVGGTSELVEPGVTGLLVRPGDAVNLVECIERAIADHGLRLKLSRAGRAKVEKEFDLVTETKRLRQHLLAHDTN